MPKSKISSTDYEYDTELRTETTQYHQTSVPMEVAEDARLEDAVIDWEVIDEDTIRVRVVDRAE